MVPLGIFRSQQFSGANAVTFAVYAALGTVTFLLVVHLQTDLGYSALEAGAVAAADHRVHAAALGPGGRAGAAHRPAHPDDHRPAGRGRGHGAARRGSIPAPPTGRRSSRRCSCSGSGSRCTVAPLTATVLGAVDDSHAGIASAINNSVARIAGLLAVAVLPAAAGLTAAQGLDLDDGFARAMYIAAVLAVVGGVLRRSSPSGAPVFVEPVAHANPAIPCYGIGTPRVAGSAA